MRGRGRAVKALVSLLCIISADKEGAALRSIKVMLWKLFGSELRVQEALEKSTGYDISPNVIVQISVNSDTPDGAMTDFNAGPRTSRYLRKMPRN